MGWRIAMVATLTSSSWACAPAASFRPASAAMGRQDSEVGMGAVAIGPRPYVDEATSYISQFWGTKRISESLKASTVVALDTSAAAAGGSLAWLAVREPWITAGLEAEVGYLWGSLGLPVAIPIAGRAHVYTAPRLGTWGKTLTPSIPLGVSVELPRGLAVRAEGQVSWADFKYYNRRLILGVALAYQFGEISR